MRRQGVSLVSTLQETLSRSQLSLRVVLAEAGAVRGPLACRLDEVAQFPQQGVRQGVGFRELGLFR